MTIRLSDPVIVCRACPQDNFRGVPVDRKAILFTLLQGAVPVIVRDWKCVWGQLVRYRGIWDAIFPVRKKALYTTELMYTHFSAIFQWCVPFRNCHAIIVGLSKDKEHTTLLQRDTRVKMERRRVCEAFSLFMTTMDTTSDPFSTELYSCSECEVQLTEEDKRTLGITGLSNNLRRYRGVVIDGTAAGIGGTLPRYERDLFIMESARMLCVKRLVHKRQQKKTLTTLMQLGRDMISKKASSVTLGYSVSISLQERFTDAQIDISRLFVDAGTCFCYQRSQGDHTKAFLRKKTECGTEHQEISDVLNKVLQITLDDCPVDEAFTSFRPSTNCSSFETDSEPPISTPGLKWYLRIAVADLRSRVQLVDSVLELALFLSVESYALHIAPAPSREPAIQEEHGIQFTVFFCNRMQ